MWLIFHKKTKKNWMRVWGSTRDKWDHACEKQTRTFAKKKTENELKPTRCK